MKCSVTRFWGVVAGLALNAQAQQQTAPPDAGVVRQQIESRRAIELPKRLAPELLAPAPQGVQGQVQGPAFQIKRFRFVGNTVLSPKDFEPLLTELAGRTLSLQQLRDQLGPQVAELYRSKGWVVHVALQEPLAAQADEVVYSITEARLGQIVFSGDAPKHVQQAQILAIFQQQLGSQSRLNNLHIDRALLLAGDLPGVAVTVRQKPGQDKGSTDLVLTVTDKPAYAGDMGWDNAGARSTGPRRLSANVEWRSPAGLGDALAASVAHTEGSDYLRLAYSLPVGSDGLRVGGNVSDLRYHVVSPEFRAQNVHGSSTSAGLDLNYPLVRARAHNLYLSGSYEHKRFDNLFGSSTNSNYEVDNLTLALNGNLFDDWGGGGANTANLSLVRGRVNLNGSPSQALDKSHTDGLFTKLRYTLSRQQNLTPTLSLYGAYTGQLSNKNLDASEKIFLGGASGVRAYPSSEAGGSEGHLLNLELRARLPEGFEASTFYDWGRVKQYRLTDFEGAPTPNSLALKGYGLSLAWRGAKGWWLKATVSHRHGNNPNPTDKGRDQDGSLKLNRFWFSANYAF